MSNNSYIKMHFKAIDVVVFKCHCMNKYGDLTLLVAKSVLLKDSIRSLYLYQASYVEDVGLLFIRQSQKLVSSSLNVSESVCAAMV